MADEAGNRAFAASLAQSASARATDPRLVPQPLGRPYSAGASSSRPPERKKRNPPAAQAPPVSITLGNINVGTLNINVPQLPSSRRKWG